MCLKMNAGYGLSMADNSHPGVEFSYLLKRSIFLLGGLV